MSQAVVVDASVALKWLVHEPESDLALELLEGQERGDLLLVTPQQAAAEVASVLIKCTRRDMITPALALELYASFLDRIDAFEATTAVDILAMRLALSTDQSLYDCLYLALALQMGCDLITADRRFFNAVHPHFACVRLLGQ